MAIALALITVPVAIVACGASPRRLTAAGESEVAALRAQGPAALEALLAAYDRAAPDERTALANTIDAVAGQRYATVSRLYWYTDLERARRAASELRRPILALRMLGDLRDDLSCANSRLFRATLYANKAVSELLRSRFVLYWSSERAVPTVTIDFGGGRKLVRTTTGNSAHYVLDRAGLVVDVLPGLYAPAVFVQELTKALALADRLSTAREGWPFIWRDHHAAAIEATERRLQQVGGAPDDPAGAPPTGSALARAQRATMSKVRIERPDLQAAGLLAPGEVPDETAAWSAIGQRAWSLVPGARATLPSVLDAASRDLIAQIHNAGPAAQRAAPVELEAVIERLEQHIAADTALNEFRLRQAIRRHMVDRFDLKFETLNPWVYEEVFATPKSDPWLGLRPRTDFTGLPSDGVVMP